MEKGQIIANRALHLEDEIRIIVNDKDYSQSREKRLIVPFVNRIDNTMGLLNHFGEVFLKPF